jgi:glycolate oxidase iron-sulfur subunit
MQVTSAIQRWAETEGRDPMGMAHTIEVLDASIRGVPVDALLSGTRA